MYKAVILMLLLFLSGVAGCIFSMNDSYDKGTGGGGSYTVSGKFIDKSGNPIVGIKVKLTGDASATALTDSNGEYMFADVSTGSYTVTPGNMGHSSKNILVTNSDVTIATNTDGHGGNIGGDYTCSGCHK